MTELPENWNKVPLLTVSDLIRGVTYSKGHARSTPFRGSIPVLRANNIQDRGFRLEDLVHVPESLVSDKQHVGCGDVVVATSSGSISVVGKAAQALENMNVGFGAFCGLLRPNKALHAAYFGFYFSSDDYRKAVSSMARGVNINNLKREHFESLQLPLAPLAEQKRIADKLEAVLGRVDACRARLDRVPALLKRFRQSVLASATSGSLTAEWRMTNGVNDALEHVEIDFEEASLSLPSSWKVTRADAVCSSVRDGTHDTPKYVKSGIPLVTSKNIRPAGIDFEGAQQISHDDHREISKRSKVDVGDVLFSMIGSVGHICIVETSREFSIKNVGLFKNNPGTVLPRYMFYWLQGPLFHQWLEPRLRGGNQKFASLGLLRESPVFLPPLPEQQEIVRRVEDLFAFADRIEARLATAQKTVERLTPATLAKAFRGELVPQDPNDEPASALLERLALQPAPKARAKRP